MNILSTILLLIVGIFAFLLILAFFMKREHKVNCVIVINAPRQKIFDYLKLIKNQEAFNKYAKVDPDRKEECNGIDGTVGYIYSWSGNKNAGCGEKEIINIIEGKRIETEIRFLKPMKTSATMIMETKSLSDNQTEVTWRNEGKLKYPLNVMIPLFEKLFAKDMNNSLLTLKHLLENNNKN